MKPVRLTPNDLNGYRPMQQFFDADGGHDIDHLWGMNDSERKSFSDIADYIEKNL